MKNIINNILSKKTGGILFFSAIVTSLISAITDVSFDKNGFEILFCLIPSIFIYVISTVKKDCDNIYLFLFSILPSLVYNGLFITININSIISNGLGASALIYILFVYLGVLLIPYYFISFIVYKIIKKKKRRTDECSP